MQRDEDIMFPMHATAGHPARKAAAAPGPGPGAAAGAACLDRVPWPQRHLQPHLQPLLQMKSSTVSAPSMLPSLAVPGSGSGSMPGSVSVSPPDEALLSRRRHAPPASPLHPCYDGFLTLDDPADPAPPLPSADDPTQQMRMSPPLSAGEATHTHPHPLTAPGAGQATGPSQQPGCSNIPRGLQAAGPLQPPVRSVSEGGGGGSLHYRVPLRHGRGGVGRGRRGWPRPWLVRGPAQRPCPRPASLLPTPLRPRPSRTGEVKAVSAAAAAGPCRRQAAGGGGQGGGRLQWGRA